MNSVNKIVISLENILVNYTDIQGNISRVAIKHAQELIESGYEVRICATISSAEDFENKADIIRKAFKSYNIGIDYITKNYVLSADKLRSNERRVINNTDKKFHTYDGQMIVVSADANDFDIQDKHINVLLRKRTNGQQVKDSNRIITIASLAEVKDILLNVNKLVTCDELGIPVKKMDVNVGSISMKCYKLVYKRKEYYISL